MKKTIIIGSLAITALSGCKKVLDTAPNNSITSSTAFSTAARVDLSLNGVYDFAQSGRYTDGSLRGYPFGAANIEQGDMRGEDMVNIATFYQIVYQNTQNSSSPNVIGLWKGLYQLIDGANVCIAGLQGALKNKVITDATATQYTAECRFLRAMAHHEALIHFARPYSDGGGQSAGVPWRDSAIASSTAVAAIYTKPRMRVDSVYGKILADLDFAEANLPATNTVYRATKAAAIALKMRVKMHMGDWAGVIAEGNKIISASAPFTSPIGGWTLDANPDDPFKLGNYSTKESIFSIKNDALDNPGVNAAISTMFAPSDHKGRGLIVISPVIYNDPRWLCDDKRRSALVSKGTDANGNQSLFIYKYRDSVGLGDYAPQIRYAEVLLTMSEAVARSAGGVSQQAIDLLNAVRNRSLGLLTEAYTAASFATQTDLVKAILFERRVEFLGEGKRWADIHRLSPDPVYGPGGIPAKALNQSVKPITTFSCGTGYTPGQGAVPYSDFRFIWPIPLTEIQQNPIIAQNPQY
ncbi:MAG TPA: RagB/SusD family nutrient uptake outer membrane protein [Puia sp.]|uniref:RagB/SusD family nutrient uptake outer membrane protein n=1 Tax=Puia sp. TaxID=2045100 RepID=UPI002C9CD516|nr:RagB/SusD family nutrient uptake outer membrane protein [Puia sp.]HVU93622.1 RagB/SusD family nutrient uptake outer membrane protein [Puia sp.]